MSRNINLLFVFVLFYVIVNSQNVFATTYPCYQESANVSTACGGLDTGSYYIAGGGNNSVLDGNWLTYYLYETPGDVLFINYSYPPGVLSVNTTFKFAPYFTDSVTKNIEVPKSGEKLNLKYTYTFDGLHVRIYGYYQNAIYSWVEFYDSTDFSVLNDWLYFFEDAIYWIISPYLNITIVDEMNTTNRIYSNITITNGTTTLQFTNTTNAFIYLTNISGTLTITANDINGEYGQRQITRTFTTDSENRNDTLYLLKSVESLRVDLNVYNSLNTEIDNALINISRQDGYNYFYVTECTTDSSGYCFVYLNDTTTYRFVITAIGYNTKTDYITPTLTSYDFTLSTPTPVYNVTSELGGVSMSLTPTTTSLKADNRQSFNFTITSNETLTSWGMEIKWLNNTGATLFSSTQSTPTGGSVNATINTTLYNQTLIVRTFLQRDGYTLRNYYTNYSIFIYTPYNHSLINMIPELKTGKYGNISNFSIALVVLFVIMLASAIFGLGTEISSAILIAGLGFMYYFALMPFGVFLLAVLVLIAYNVWKG